MIYCYSNSGAGADISIQNLEFFLDQVVQVFEYEGELAKAECDLLLIDARGLHYQKIRRIIKHHIGVPVVLMSDKVFDGLNVAAVVSATSSLRDIAAICRTILCKKIIYKTLNLSLTEEIFLKELMLGHSNKEIARSYDLPLSTTKYYLRNLYQKLDVKNRTQAALKAREIIV